MRHSRSMMLKLAVCAVAAAGCAGTRPVVAPVGQSAMASSQGAGDFGSLPKVCGPGLGRGANALGVSDKTIDVGTMADPGAADSPGLHQELFDTATAFTKWCNDAGGIAGRKLSLHLRDAKLTDVVARMTDACGQDFAEVGGGTASDDAGVPERLNCGLPDIPALVVSPLAADAARKVQGDPGPLQEQQVAVLRGVQQTFAGAYRAGYLVENVPNVLTDARRAQEGAERIGFRTVLSETYEATGVADPAPIVQRMRDKRLDVLTVFGDPAALVSVEKAMKTAGWYPNAIVEGSSFYDKKLIRDGADALKNTWVATTYYPLELAKSNPATAQYVAIVNHEVPGAKISALGLAGFDAWLLFAIAARDCGPALSRTCLLEKAAAQPDWTGGGLKAPANTSTENPHANPCAVVMKADSSGFTLDPSFLPPNQSIFNCSPDNVVLLKGDYRPKA